MDDFGSAGDDGLRTRAALDGGDVEPDGLAAFEMGFRRFPHDRLDRCLAQHQVVLSGPAHGLQDHAAAVGLLSDQAGVLHQFRAILQFLHQFAADQLDRGKGRPQFMGGRSHDTAKVGQFLFAGQGKLRGHQRLAHGMHLGRDLTGIERQEDQTHHKRDPETELEDGGQHQKRAFRSHQRQIHHAQHRGKRDGGHAQQDRIAQMQDGCRDGDRGKDQHCKGVVQPAGQEQQQ